MKSDEEGEEEDENERERGKRIENREKGKLE